MCDTTQAAERTASAPERERDVDDLIFRDQPEWLVSDR